MQTMVSTIPLFCLLLVLVGVHADNNKLPDGFLVGFATASYQVEGAWNEDGKLSY